MENKFDPYRKWLGIAPKDQPPTKYRLLGIDLFEDDPDVISNAADQRMSHLRTFQTGQYSELSQQILGEVSGAKLTLLDPLRKSTYDAELKQQLKPAATPPPAPASGKAPPRPTGTAQPPTSTAQLPTSTAPPPVASSTSSISKTAFVTPVVVGNNTAPASDAPEVRRFATGATSGARTSTAARGRRKKSNATAIVVTIIVLASLTVAGIVLMNLGGNGPKPNESDNGSPLAGDRTDRSSTPGTNGGGSKAPKIDKIANQVVTPSEELRLVIRASGSRLAYALEAAPPGARLDPNSGILSWRPLSHRPGYSHPVTVRVTDPSGKDDAVTFQVNVVEEPKIEGGGLRAEFFGTPDLEQPIGERIDPLINFFWNNDAPMAGAPADRFSVRWTGYVVAPSAGKYRFSVFADDGVRVWVNDRLVIDDWKPAQARRLSGRIRLAAGAQPIRVEYFDGTGDATIQLRWDPPGELDQIIPATAFRLEKSRGDGGGFTFPTREANTTQGLRVQYYRGGNFAEEIKTWRETDLDWRWSGDVGDRRLVEGPFSVRMSGMIFAPEEGEYVLSFTGNGKFGVELDGERIASQDLQREQAVTETVKVRLSREPQPIRIGMSAGSGPGEFIVRWQRPGEQDDDRFELIPPDFLRVDRPVVATEPPRTEPETPPLTAAEQQARRLIAGVLEFGGQIMLSGMREPIRSANEMPPGALEAVALVLENDRVEDKHLAALAALPGLQTLKLSSSEITDDGLRKLVTLEQLTNLDIRAPQITSGGVQALLKLRKLESLSLASDAIDDRVFVTLKRIPSLKSLAVESDRLTGDEVNELRELSSLRQLTLISGALQDAKLRGLRALEQVQVLAINGPIAASGIESLAGSNAYVLAITSDRLDDDALIHLGNLPNLRGLRLVSRQIDDDGCLSLAKCLRLEQLEVLNAGGITAAGVERLLSAPALKRARLLGANMSRDDLEELQSGTQVKLSIE